MSNSTPETANRAQRILAFMIATLVIVALLCFAAAMIGYATGAIANSFNGLWGAVIMIPYFALPVALLLTVALLAITGVRRSRENRAR